MLSTHSSTPLASKPCDSSIPHTPCLLRCKPHLLSACIMVLENEEAAQEIGIRSTELQLLRDTYLPNRTVNLNGRTISTIRQMRRAAHIKLFNAFQESGDTREDLLEALLSIRFHFFAEELTHWMQSKGNIDIQPLTYERIENRIARGVLEHFARSLGIEIPGTKSFTLTPKVVDDLGFAIETQWHGQNRFLIALEDATLLTTLGTYKPLLKNTSPRSHLVRLIKCVLPVDINKALESRPVEVRPGKSIEVKLFPQRTNEVSHQEVTLPPSCTDTDIQPVVRSSDIALGLRRVYLVGVQTGIVYEHIDLLSTGRGKEAKTKIVSTRYCDARPSQLRKELQTFLEGSNKAPLIFSDRKVYSPPKLPHQRKVLFLEPLVLRAQYPFDTVDVHILHRSTQLIIDLFTPGGGYRSGEPFQRYRWSPTQGLRLLSKNPQLNLISEPEDFNLRLEAHLTQAILANDRATLATAIRSDPLRCYEVLVRQTELHMPYLQYLARKHRLPQDQISDIKTALNRALTKLIATDLTLFALVCAKETRQDNAILSLMSYVSSRGKAIISHPRATLENLTIFAPEEKWRAIKKLEKQSNPLMQDLARRIRRSK